MFPIVTAAIIFVAVFLDSARHRQLRELGRRKIRPPAPESAAP
jgi:hypothetical protein